MTDSNAHEELAAKHERNREQRIEAIKEWIRYIRSEPPETWGPQQNTVVNSQLDAAQRANISLGQQQHVRSVASDIVANSSVKTTDSDSIDHESTTHE